MPRIPEVYPTVFCPHLHFSNIGPSILRIVHTAYRLLPSAFCLLLTAFFIFHSSLTTVHAQGATATLSGTVTDQNGAVIPGVNIAVISIAQGFQRLTTTNDEGTFVVPLLPPGKYTVKAEREGFSTAELRDVVLNVNDQVAINIRLSIGNISQTVQVEGGSLIDESPAVGTIVDRQFVENIPLNGRSFQPLITLSPGVVLTKASAGEQGQLSVNGQRANANYFTVDGVSANVGIAAAAPGQSGGGALPALSVAGGTNSLVSVDALQEFKIQTSTYAPEFGRTPGAQVSIVTRSGTNDFHGTLFEYFRNDVLDANDWFANSRPLTAQQVAQGLTKQKRAALRQNDFGGVFGGPLYLPRFGEGGPSFNIGKNRTFFFFSYEGLRLRQPQTALTLVPSIASRLAALPERRPFLDAYPIPNGNVFANGFAQFNGSFSAPLQLDATSIRVDHTFNEKMTLFGRYNYSPSKTSQRGIESRSLNSLIDTRFKTQTLTVGVTQSLTSSMSNEIRLNYSRSDGKSNFRLDDLGGAVVPPDSLLFPSFASTSNSFFRLFIVGGGVLTAGRNVENIQRQINLVDNWSKIIEAHQLKLGIDYRLLLPVSGPRGYEQVVNYFSGLIGPTGAISGNAPFAQVGARETVALKVTNFSAYAQDTWKATPRLTITYGFRWDVNPAPKGRNGKDLITFDNLDNLTALSLAPKGTPLYETTYNNFAPRAGVSYQLSQAKGRETLLRGGVGIFNDLGIGSLANASAFFPYARLRNMFGVPFPLTLIQSVPPPFSLSIPVSGIAIVSDRKLKLPRTYQWNMALERSLGTAQTLTVSYVAAIGRRLLRQEAVTFPPAFSIDLVRNTATSDYHALQLQYQRRLSSGLQALASYTWSHSIDIASNDSSGGASLTNPKLDRGSSDFDVRHAFNAAVTYNVPSVNVGPAAKELTKNWTVDTIVTARSATPVDLIAGFGVIGGRSIGVRPDIITGVPLYIDDPQVAGGRRFNGAAFTMPAAGRQGTLGRNVLRGFPVFQLDLALHRQFHLKERLNMQLRAEAFNVLNHPNFGDPGNFQGNFLPSPFFGQSTSLLGASLGTGGASGGFSPLYQVGGPRSIQLAVKLSF